MAAQYEQQPGNYLAFFSSFDYLERAAAAFAATYPRIPHWTQARRQLDSERAGFLDRFEVDGRGIGFAVLGGSFAEGIDLPGSRLVGAFIATLGLPQTNPINDAMRSRLEVVFGSGYDYAYLYPGMRKVVQAAGRVIRTPEDKGVVYLIDDRFSRPAVRALLPEWWPRSSRQRSRRTQPAVRGDRAGDRLCRVGHTTVAASNPGPERSQQGFGIYAVQDQPTCTLTCLFQPFQLPGITSHRSYQRASRRRCVLDRPRPHRVREHRDRHDAPARKLENRCRWSACHVNPQNTPKKKSKSAAARRETPQQRRPVTST